jgi:adenosylmethionine-8-amino-7-oxononanoate aminotransferase
MKNIFALLGLTKYALANLYMSRDERRRVHAHPRKASLATGLRSALALTASFAMSLVSDVRAIGILCAIALRNLWHDAKAAFRGKQAQDLTTSPAEPHTD